MDEDRLILVVAVLAVAVSIFAAGVTYLSVASFSSKISGLATGEANLTVESVAQINFSDDSINWGSGRVNAGKTAAFLDTTLGTVTSGNWTAQTGLRIENIGNNNVSLNISGTKTAAALLGGTSPAYRWNVSNNESGSCLNSSGGTTMTGSEKLDIFVTVNTSVASLFCGRFQFVDASDQVRIDFNVTVPDDALTGAAGDVITATAIAV